MHADDRQTSDEAAKSGARLGLGPVGCVGWLEAI